KTAHWNSGGLFIAHVGRFCCDQPFLRQTVVFGVRTKMKASICKDLVSVLEQGHLVAYCFNLPRKLLSQNLLSWARIPNPTRKTNFHNNRRLRLLSSQSPFVTVAAWTLISTSLALGVGFSTSLSWRTSGGPYL